MSILLKIRKSIFITISILKLANKKVFSKNWAFFSLSFTYKLTKTIFNVLKIELSIFYTLTSVWYTLRPSFDTYASIIVLILLLELIKA